MPKLLYVLQLILGLMFYTLIGQGLLAAFFGERRRQNGIYLAMDKVAWGPKKLAGALLPDLQSVAARRVAGGLIACLAWVAIMPTIAPVLAYWRVLRVEYLFASWILLLVFLFGTAMTVPPQWLKSFNRGLLAMALLALLNRALVLLFRSQGWLPG